MNKWEVKRNVLGENDQKSFDPPLVFDKYPLVQRWLNEQGNALQNPDTRRPAPWDQGCNLTIVGAPAELPVTVSVSTDAASQGRLVVNGKVL